MVSTSRILLKDFTKTFPIDKTHTKGRRDWKVRHREHLSFGYLSLGFDGLRIFVALWCFSAKASKKGALTLLTRSRLGR